MAYRLFIRPLLYLLSAERAHHLVIALLSVSQWIPGGMSLLRWIFARTGRPVFVMGIRFPNPIGLAAGFDKDAEVFRSLGALGFGFVEVGTVTAEPQPGNPQPRLFRLPRDRALINRMGFNNRGAVRAAARLSALGGTRPVLGINIGKTKLASPEQTVQDYVKSTRLLAPYADYFVINVSSPNTPGLRGLQAVDSLRPIVVAVKYALAETVPTRRVPLLVKIAPDLVDDDVRALARFALEVGLDGLIATNTTVGRAGLRTPQEEVAACGAGGLSGAPLKKRALEVLRVLFSETQGRIALVAAGGIENAADVVERLKAGADLVQVYSALVYEGPGLPGRLAAGTRTEIGPK